MIKKLFVTCILSIFVQNIYAKPIYLSEDVVKYNETGICENCNLSDAHLLNHIPSANLTGANFTRASFRSGEFEKANFTNAIMTATSLDHEELTAAIFRGAYMEGVDLFGSNLSNADFTNAKFVGVNLEATNLCHAIISTEQLDNSEVSSTTIMPNCHYYKPE